MGSFRPFWCNASGRRYRSLTHDGFLSYGRLLCSAEPRQINYQRLCSSRSRSNQFPGAWRCFQRRSLIGSIPACGCCLQYGLECSAYGRFTLIVTRTRAISSASTAEAALPEKGGEPIQAANEALVDSVEPENWVASVVRKKKERQNRPDRRELVYETPRKHALLFSDAVVHCRGDDLPFGSREYILLPPNVSLHEFESLEKESRLLRNETGEQISPSVPSLPWIASLRAHRHMIFGATIRNGDLTGDHVEQMLQNQASVKSFKMIGTVGPLLDAALSDCSSTGEQPQTLATVNGLCSWVALQFELLEEKQIRKAPPESKVLQKYWQRRGTDKAEMVELVAVRAMATGIPRSQQPMGTMEQASAVEQSSADTIGLGTYRDGQELWERLAKEYISEMHAEQCTADEIELYRSRRGVVTHFEYLALADTGSAVSPSYLREAGGIMARLFFV
jgi:hypothetical protein